MTAQALSFPVRVVALIGIELIAWLLTQMILARFPWTSPVAESLRTMLRLETATFDWYLFRGMIAAGARPSNRLREPAVAVGMLLMLSVPLLVPHVELSAPLAAFFALTSIAVGIKEEVLFRAILQPLLQHRLGAIAAVGVTSIVFTAWHAGAVPLTPSVAAEIFLASVVLGIAYLHTGNLLAVISLHAAYDALYVLAPGAVHGERDLWALAPLGAAACCLAMSACSRATARREVPSQCQAPGLQGARDEASGAPGRSACEASEAAALGFVGQGRRGWAGPVRTQQPIS